MGWIMKDPICLVLNVICTFLNRWNIIFVNDGDYCSKNSYSRRPRMLHKPLLFVCWFDLKNADWKLKLPPALA